MNETGYDKTYDLVPVTNKPANRPSPRISGDWLNTIAILLSTIALILSAAATYISAGKTAQLAAETRKLAETTERVSQSQDLIETRMASAIERIPGTLEEITLKNPTVRSVICNPGTATVQLAESSTNTWQISSLSRCYSLEITLANTNSTRAIAQPSAIIESTTTCEAFVKTELPPRSSGKAYINLSDCYEKSDLERRSSPAKFTLAVNPE